MNRTKIIFAAILTVMGNHAFAQSDYDISKDRENGATVFTGACSFDDLRKEPAFTWLERGAEAYKPDTEAVKYLRAHIGEYDFVVLMGTWCDDTQNLLPKFYKTLQLSGYPMGRLKMYGVNREKESKYVEHKLYKLKKVPTIIVIRNYMEIGRVEEAVKRNIETDLIALIQKDIESRQ